MIKLAKLSELLFPSRFTCNFCKCEINKESKHDLCEKCLESIPYMKERVCIKCGGSLKAEEKVCSFCKTVTRYFTMARAPLEYSGAVSTAIQNLKYHNKKYLAKTLAYFMSLEYFKNDFVADVIIPIPLYKDRQKKRGFNQSDILGEELSKLIGVEMNTKAFARIRHTAYQTKLNYAERQENLKGCFKVIDKSALKGKRILLIDDVFTTGATLENASETLKKEANTGKIFALTVAHTVVE